MIAPQHDRLQQAAPKTILDLVRQLAQGRIRPLRQARQAGIRWALAQTEGNVARAAERLGTSRSTVYRYARASSRAQ